MPEVTPVEMEKGEFFIEDTSLHFECMNGFPGPFIKWMLKAVGNQGIYDAVSKYKNHDALGRCVVGYTNGKEMHFFVGEMKGKIVEPRGVGGFG